MKFLLLVGTFCNVVLWFGYVFGVIELVKWYIAMMLAVVIILCLKNLLT